MEEEIAIEELHMNHVFFICLCSLLTLQIISTYALSD